MANAVLAYAAQMDQREIELEMEGDDMKRMVLLMGCVIGFCFPGQEARALLVTPARMQLERPWWVSGEFGEGQLKFSSDQLQGDRVPTFAMSFAGGRQVGESIRFGLKLNGWTLESSDPYDLTKGESVSNVMGMVDVFPLPRTRLFVRGGFGWASYTNNHLTALNGDGVGWETGVGYEIPLRGQLRLAPIVEYAAGSLGDAQNTAKMQTGGYSVLEFKLAIVYRFGSHGRYGRP
jgi:hypothetical protein